MIKRRIYLVIALAIGLIVFFSGCGDDTGDNKENLQNLENNIKSLEDAGKIKTFPLTIIVSDQLSGESLPENLQQLCAVSKHLCKTLPIAGILRLGSNNYYEYNCISSLVLPENKLNNEADITDTVEKQVNTYLKSVKLGDFDSLVTVNHRDWDITALSFDYINHSTDSIFFFSESMSNSGTFQIEDKTYFVFNNLPELRRKIDEIICKGQRTISVFYSPPALDANRVTVTKSKWPSKGTVAGDTCIKFSKYEKLHNGSGGFTVGDLTELNSKSCGFSFPTGLAGDTCVNTSKYQKLHNGKGGFMLGNLIESNSKSCGFVFPTGRAGDTCVSGSKYQKLHNGKGGFTVGSLVERNSKSCGFVFPTGRAGDTCVSGSRYQKLHNGRGGFTVGILVERNSKSCGFVFPTGRAGDTCVSGSKYQKLHNGRGGFAVGSLVERNSKSCGFVFPTGRAGDTCVSGSKYQRLHNGRGGFMRGSLIERNSRDCGIKYPEEGTVAEGFICAEGSKYVKLHNGKGGFVTGALIEANSSQCAVAAPKDNACASRSDAVCEKDNTGSYTGRRVQYCYNRSGAVIKTIVISKCDGDCRCLGR